MNKRQGNTIARKMANRLDTKNAPSVDVATIKDIVLFCHEHDLKIPKPIEGLLLVRVLRLAIDKGQLSA